MRVLHLVAADRWTGAAATALALVEALRAAGVEAELAFRPGNNLEPRLRGHGWAHAILRKERSPAEFARNVAAVRDLAARFEIVDCHLPHDHALARLALRGSGTGRSAPSLVRSVRHDRHLRPDPFHRWLFRRTSGVALAHAAMTARAARIPALRDVPLRVLPAPVEPHFRPLPPERSRRERLGLPVAAPVAVCVGKLAAGRGQDLLLHAVAAAPRWHALIVGAGESERGLRRLARRLEVADRVVFAGYVEDGLEALYAASDLLVFPAAGSDHGHRAIAEAAACGVPALAADLPGVSDLVEAGVTGDLFPADDAAALAVLLQRWNADPARRRVAGERAAARASELWRPRRVAADCLAFYHEILGRP